MYRLDATPTLADHRDFMVRPYLDRLEKKTGETHWRCNVTLDQGVEGSCVGNGWTTFLNAEPFPHHFDEAFAKEIYHEATRIDSFPGDWRTGQEGTDVRSGARVVRRKGFIEHYGFAADVEEAMLWLLNHGPVVIGVPWLNSMDHPEGEYAYTPVDFGSGVRGGHCVALLAARWTGGLEGSWVYFRNSWGPSWGHDGGGRFTAKDFESLLNVDGSVACTALELAHRKRRR